MNEQLKKRLVGAVVLVALVVIFVPMLLEGDKRAGIPVFGSNVPESPEHRLGTVDIPLQVPPATPPAPVVVEQASSPEPEPAPAAAPVAPLGTAVPPRPTAPAGAPTSEPAAPPTKPADSAPSPKKPSATASWTVQVGSFTESANASRLRDDLRAKGYPAYVEQVKINGANAFRVRVGPVLSRADAEAIQGRLAKIDQQGIVVPHP